MIPLFPTTCLILSLLFLLIQHRKGIRSILRKYTTPNYSRLPVYQHEVELDHLHRYVYYQYYYLLSSCTPPTFLDQPNQLYHCLHRNLTLPTELTKHIKP